jgi:splicing factor 45
MRRPAVGNANQKSRPKFAFAKAQSSSDTAPLAASSPDKPLVPVQPQTKMTLADWQNDDDDDEFYYQPEKRERGGKKKKKKKNNEPEVQHWDDLYDPTRPNNYEEYMRSDERIREIREWKEHLYHHCLVKNRRNSDLSSNSDNSAVKRPGNTTEPLSYVLMLILF